MARSVAPPPLAASARDAPVNRDTLASGPTGGDRTGGSDPAPSGVLDGLRSRWRAQLEPKVAALADVTGVSVARLVAGAVAVAALGIAVWLGVNGVGNGVGPLRPTTLPKALHGPGSGDAAGGGDGATSGAPAGGSLVVYVTGAVTRQGVVTLPAGARVSDAIAAAGGPAPDADLELVNLAAKLDDGQRVRLPRRGEPPGTGALAGDDTGSGNGPAAPVNLNTASVDQLDRLPGIGPSTAAAIVAWRNRHGSFRSVRDLLKIGGIGPAKLARLDALVRV